MRKELENAPDTSQPALIVTYGNTTRKRRPLNGDLVVIGRSSCCDIGLVSPEVAPIHCVMVRGGDGWRIRDCTGRSGTRVNGKAITEELLHDGDALQIGTFSFQLNLPHIEPTEGFVPQAVVAPAAATMTGLAVAPSQLAADKADDSKLNHLKQSRERLARHALNLRRKLREKNAVPPPLGPITPSRFDAELNAKRAELEQLEKKFKFWEKELTEQDRSLREEYCEIEHQRKELERFAQDSLARKQVEVERKAQAILADQRKELEAELERTISQRRTELDQIAESLKEREQKLEVERDQMEERLLQVLIDKRQELAAAEKDLKTKQTDLEDQLKQAEQIVAAAAEGREALQLEFQDVERMRQEAQEELSGQVREAEEHLEKLWQQCEAHRRQVEEQHGPIVALPDVAALTHDLDVRSRELDHFAGHLRRQQATLTQYEQELSEAYHQFHEEYDKAVKETTARKQSEKNDAVAESLTSELHIAETIIAEMREETEQLRADFETKLTEERERVAQAQEQIKSLQTEIADLKQELKQREEILEHLKAEIRQREEESRPPSLNGEIELTAPERLMELVEKLQQDVVERDGQIRELHQRIQKLQVLADPDEKVAFETELNRFRLELEQDRTWLNDEMARLNVSKAEIDETRQEEELRISHERVEIAREWAEINRIRDQLKREATKPDKSENGARERPKAKLTTRTEAVELTPAPTPTMVTPQPDLIARLARTSRAGGNRE